MIEYWETSPKVFSSTEEVIRVTKYLENQKILILLQIGNLLAFLGTVLVNSLANIIPIGGKNTGELSDALPNLFVPAGYVFAIWGVIYLLLMLFSVYQILPKQRESLFLKRINILFIIGSLANIIWIFLWHYQLVPLSLIAMLVLLGSLLAIYLRLGIGVKEATRNEKILVHLPFSVYLGWITVATVANVTALLVSLPIDWTLYGFDVVATITILFVVLGVTVAMLISRKDIAYALVVVWALLGISVKQISGQIGVAVFAGTFAGVIVLGILLISYLALRKWLSSRKKQETKISATS